MAYDVYRGKNDSSPRMATLAGAGTENFTAITEIIAG